MLTNVIDMTTTSESDRPRDLASSAARTAQKVVIVNGGDEVLELLETVLDAGHYDVVFVESARHAYSQIKKVQPNLVILCLDLDADEGFRVLSMLKLDDETRDIPLLTCAVGPRDEQDEEPEPSEEEVFAPRPVLRMN
jgi:PleD family two-component response regulator